MKKLIGLMVLLMTIVTLSASAQCPNTSIPKRQPNFFGDRTPCKNQKKVPYVLDTVTVRWCPDWAGTITQYRWIGPLGSVITDGVNTSPAGGYLYTTSTRVWVDYKTKNGSLGYDYKDQCGTWWSGAGVGINLNCDPDGGPTSFNGAWAPSGTANAIGVTPNATSSNIALTIDSISGMTKPYSNMTLYVKSTNCTTTTGTYFSDGWYVQVTANYPSFPIYAYYGWSPIGVGATYTARIIGKDANGASFITNTFTLNTTP